MVPSSVLIGGYIAIAEATAIAKAVGVIDQTLPCHREGLKPAMWMFWEAGNALGPVIHIPACAVAKVGPKLMP